MRVRAVLMFLVASLLCFPAWASQPEGSAGKLIANPPFTPKVDDPVGLPPVTCTGFAWGESFPARQLDPADVVTLEVAIVPFRSGFTDVSIASLARLRFADGLVNGIPYKRSAWNDVKVEFHPASQDYLLTINGVQAGPFGNEFPCSQSSECLTLAGLTIRGGVFEESVAWIDSLSLVRDSIDGREVIFQNGYDQCYAGHDVFLGGLLVLEPPQRLGAGGTR